MVRFPINLIVFKHPWQGWPQFYSEMSLKQCLYWICGVRNHAILMTDYAIHPNTLRYSHHTALNKSFPCIASWIGCKLILCYIHDCIPPLNTCLCLYIMHYGNENGDLKLPCRVVCIYWPDSCTESQGSSCSLSSPPPCPPSPHYHTPSGKHTPLAFQ